MHWSPPNVRTTPRLRTAYKLYNFIEKRCAQTSPNGKYTYYTPRIQCEINKLTKIISEEQRALRLLELCTEPLFSEMGNSIVSSVTKNLESRFHDETNSLLSYDEL